jgi:hypothetical protein
LKTITKALFLFLLVLLGAVQIKSQAGPFSYTWATPTGTGPLGSAVSFVNGPVPSNFTIAYAVTGTPGACTFKVEGSPDNSSWSTLVSSTSCTATGLVTVSGTPVNYLRINLLTYTASGATVIFSQTNAAPGLQGSGSGTVNSSTTGKMAYYAANGTAVSGTSTPISTFLDTGGAVFNVKAFGALGDNSTNDCTAISNTVTAQIAAGGGKIFFPTGKYVVGSACHITITKPGILGGVGQCGQNFPNCASIILSSDTTGVLFTVDTTTAHSFDFENISMQNTATPVSGAGILVNGTDALARVSLVSTALSGFYDNVDHFTGALWTMDKSFLFAPQRDNISIKNTNVADYGDWSITNSDLNLQGSVGNAGRADIYAVGSGGGRITNNQILGSTTPASPQYGIFEDCPACGTNGLNIINNTISEFFVGFPVYLNGLNIVEMIGNGIATGGTNANPAVTFIGTNFFFGGGSMVLNANEVPILASQSGASGYIMPFVVAGGPAANVLTGTNIFDWSRMGNLPQHWLMGNLNLIAATNANVSGAVQIAAANGSNQTLTMTGNVTGWTDTNFSLGDLLSLKLCQDATGSRTQASSGGALGQLTRTPYAFSPSTCTHVNMIRQSTQWQVLSETFEGTNQFGGLAWTVPSGCGTVTGITGLTIALPVTGAFNPGQTSCAPVLNTGMSAVNGWSCRMTDITNGAVFVQTAKSTTGCTMGAQTVATSDTVLVEARPLGVN